MPNTAQTQQMLDWPRRADQQLDEDMVWLYAHLDAAKREMLIEAMAIPEHELWAAPPAPAAHVLQEPATARVPPFKTHARYVPGDSSVVYVVSPRLKPSFRAIGHAQMANAADDGTGITATGATGAVQAPPSMENAGFVPFLGFIAHDKTFEAMSDQLGRVMVCGPLDLNWLSIEVAGQIYPLERESGGTDRALCVGLGQATLEEFAEAGSADSDSGPCFR